MHSQCSRMEELEALLGASFLLKEEQVQIGSLALSLRLPANIDSLIDAITPETFAEDERLPYWADLWHSAVALGGYLHEHPDLVKGQNVVELGCGLGLPGIVAALHGAKVDFTDYEPATLLAAELNLLRIAGSAEARFLTLDFRYPPEAQWPVVLAADIIYERRFIQPLVACLAAILAQDGIILLAEPNRGIAEPFFAALREAGFSWSRQERFADLRGRRVGVGVYVITRK